jgi:hypothetical protein
VAAYDSVSTRLSSGPVVRARAQPNSQLRPISPPWQDEELIASSISTLWRLSRKFVLVGTVSCLIPRPVRRRQALCWHHMAWTEIYLIGGTAAVRVLRALIVTLVPVEITCMSLQPGLDPLAAVRCIDRLPFEILSKEGGIFRSTHRILANRLAEPTLPWSRRRFLQRQLSCRVRSQPRLSTSRPTA